MGSDEPSTLRFGSRSLEKQKEVNKMNQNCFNKKAAYKEEMMTKSVCLICNEHYGKYEYRGKPVCINCLELIRANF